MGAYDIPAYEWGPASSPIIWNHLFNASETRLPGTLLLLARYDKLAGHNVYCRGFSREVLAEMV